MAPIRNAYVTLALAAASIAPAMGATAPDTGWYVATVAGSGVSGYADGQDLAAQFTNNSSIAQDSEGNLYIADTHRIRKITPSGLVSTYAGKVDPGFADGSLDSARFNQISGLWFSRRGDLYVVDSYNHRIRKIDAHGRVSTFAGGGPIGQGQGGFKDSTAAQAIFNNPIQITGDSLGNLFVVDWGNNRIRKIDSAGTVTTLAGDGQAAYRDGAAAQAEFNQPFALALGPGGRLYVADKQNHRVRVITSDGQVGTVAGSGPYGYGGGGFADGGATSAARFNEPVALAWHKDLGLLVADMSNNRIRRVTPDSQVATVAGGDQGFRDGPAHEAMFYAPATLWADTAGALFVGEYHGLRIRRLSRERPQAPRSAHVEGCWNLVVGDNSGPLAAGNLCVLVDSTRLHGFVSWSDLTWGFADGLWTGDSLDFTLTNHDGSNSAWTGHYQGRLLDSLEEMKGKADHGGGSKPWDARRDMGAATVSAHPILRFTTRRDAHPWLLLKDGSVYGADGRLRLRLR